MMKRKVKQRDYFYSYVLIAISPSYEIVFRGIPQNITKEKLTLFLAMAGYLQATKRYLSQIDPDLCLHMASSGHYELKHEERPDWMIPCWSSPHCSILPHYSVSSINVSEIIGNSNDCWSLLERNHQSATLLSHFDRNQLPWFHYASYEMCLI